MKEINKKILVFVFFVLFFAISSSKVNATTSFLNAYTTLNNSRFSYVGTLNGAYTNASVFTMNNTAGAFADRDTSNLFPNDSLIFKAVGGTAYNGGTSYNVASINTATIFRTGSTVTSSMSNGDLAISNQTTRMTVSFIPRTPVPAGGKVVITIQGNGIGATNADGFADIGGYDSASLNNANIGTYSTAAFFTYSGIGMSSNSGQHIITLTGTSAINVGTSCAFTVGSASTAAYRFINPVPPGGQTSGVSISYGVAIETQDAASNTLDQIVTKVVPNDGVLVSANVEMSLNYTIAGVGMGTTACGTASSVTTTATAVPFNAITSFTAFYDAAQTHLISTNANSGYTLTVQQDQTLTDSLGSGATIPATKCQSSNCSTTAATSWTDPVLYKGFGYSVGHLSGNTDESFTFSTGYKQFDSATPQNILFRTSPTDGSQAYTCYRLAISTTQPIGYYFNKLTYVATPKF